MSGGGRVDGIPAGDAGAPRSRAWGITMLAFGLFHIADWLYVGLDEPFRLLTGLGFLLLAPEAFRNPISLRTPLRQAFAPRPRSSGAHDWLAGLGVLLLLAALALRWL